MGKLTEAEATMFWILKSLNLTGKSSCWMMRASRREASRDASSLLAPVTTILPDAKISAVVLGSLMRMITAENRLGLYSALRARRAIFFRSSGHPRLVVDTMFCRGGTMPEGCTALSTCSGRNTGAKGGFSSESDELLYDSSPLDLPSSDNELSSSESDPEWGSFKVKPWRGCPPGKSKEGAVNEDGVNEDEEDEDEEDEDEEDEDEEDEDEEDEDEDEELRDDMSILKVQSQENDLVVFPVIFFRRNTKDFRSKVIREEVPLRRVWLFSHRQIPFSIKWQMMMMMEIILKRCHVFAWESCTTLLAVERSGG